MSVASLLSRTGACLVISLASACSRSGSNESSQVVARVGDKELTAAQLDARMLRLPADTDKNDPQVLKVLLKNFIDETLLAQAAEKDKLDKKPGIVRDIETSRNVVLANAYISRNIASRPPSETAIRSYYNDNPALFSNRRTYRLTDVAVREGQRGAAVVIAEMRRSTATIESVLSVARQGNVQVETASGVSSGDNLPTKLVSALSGMGVGDNATYRVAQTEHFTRVDGVADAPVSLVTAHDTIGGVLLTQAREAAVEAKLGQLRTEYTIEYGTIGREIQAGRGSGAARPKAQPAQSGTRDGAIARGAESL